MIDVHCHVNFRAFDNDYKKVIDDALTEGVTKIINVGTQISSSKRAVEMAEKYDDLYAIVGVHPHHADKIFFEEGWLEELTLLVSHPKVLAIGEIGLDYYSYKSNGIVDPALQKNVFMEQLELAHTYHVPLQIHTRDEQARQEIIALLQDHKQLLEDPPGMFHCMAGSLEALKSALRMGFFVGFDGNITYKGIPPGEPVALTELANYTPLDRIVIETDSPYLSPMPFRGQRNEPKYAIITARFLAELKHVPFEKLVEQTDKNVYTMFRKLTL